MKTPTGYLDRKIYNEERNTIVPDTKLSECRRAKDRSEQQSAERAKRKFLGPSSVELMELS